jgi:hypothetical protein
MAEYDNSNKAAGWLRESKTGNKYISLMLNVEGKEYTLALFKNEVEEGSKSLFTQVKLHQKVSMLQVALQ